MGKTPPEEKEAEGSPRKKAPRVGDAPPTTRPVGLPPRPPTGKAPRVGDAPPTTRPVGLPPRPSPTGKAPRVGDAPPTARPVALPPSPTGKRPLEGDAGGSPLKRSRNPQNESLRWPDKWPEAVVGRVTDEMRCKCNHVITASAVEELSAIGEFIPLLNPKSSVWSCYGCWREDKKGIVKTRPEKSDLMICMTCYDHLCCGVGSVNYPFGHSRAHALKKQHWYAVLYCDPERGYCFKCDQKVSMAVKFGEDVSQEIRGIVRRKPSVGQTEAKVNPKKVETTGKVQAGSRPSGFGVDLAHKRPSYESRSSGARGYAIRGIPNYGNTCYMNAVLQCLFVLGKLRERMLAPDHPNGILPEILRELFVETSGAGDVLDPRKVLVCVGMCKKPRFQVGAMEDSHELLMALRDICKEGEKVFDRQSDTVIDSIFGFEMLRTASCEKCGPSLKSEYFLDLTLKFPSKWHPTKSSASRQTSEGPRSRKNEIDVQLSLAAAETNLEKMHIDSERGCSRDKPLEVDSSGSEDSIEAQCISQSKDVVQSPLQIQEGESVDSLIEDSVEYLLLFYSEGPWSCSDCAKDENVGDTFQICRFIRLPPVLTLHLNRTSHDTDGIKISGHVRFKEYLDVKRFMDSSSVDKGSTRYRLAGVVEHIGNESLADGHYIAYVRGSRLGNQQEGSSCSSSWFCANDKQIRQVTLENVLNSEAYILFYERMEDQDISATRRQN